MRKNTLTYRIVMILLLLCQAGWMQAMVYHRTPYAMTQPNGERVTVYLYGSDLYIEAESVDRYTLTKDEKSGEICYALLSADKREYASSGIVYKGGEAPDAVKMIVEPAIRITPESRNEKIAQTKLKLGKEIDGEQPTLRAATALPDTVYGLCILIDFPDEKSAVTRDQIEQFLNGDNNPQFGNARSIKEYFQWISSGKLTYINYVPKRFYTTPQNHSYYAPLNATDYTINLLIPEIRNAINEWEKEQPGNLSKLNRNIYGGIMALNILYAGKCENKWATGLWPHQSNMQMKLDGNTFSRNAYHAYQITDIDKKLTMGTFVHENGHLVCGWPDFYQYEEHEANNASTYNIGDAFFISSETNPTYPNAWAMDQLGWLTDKQDISQVTGGKQITLKQGVGHAAVYRGKGKNSQETFYIEVRDRHYATWYNDDKGIFIWHSNENGDNNYPNKDELLDCRPASSNNPFWVKGNGPDHFSDDTNPSAKWVDGSNSGIYLWDFSAYGESMTFRCGEFIETPEFTKKELKKGGVHNHYVDTLTVEGGVEPYRIIVYEGKLPNGVTLNENGVLTGAPTEVGEESFTAQVIDSRGKQGFMRYTLSVITSTPFYDQPIAIPGSFQMEEYDKGGYGISYQSDRPSNYIRNDEGLFPLFQFINRQNNQPIGYTVIYGENNEWTQYTINVEEERLYNLSMRNSTNYDAILSIALDYEPLDTMLIHGVPNVRVTSNSTGYKYTNKLIELPQGIHTLRFTTENTTHPLYVDSVSITPLAAPTYNEDITATEYHLLQNPTTEAFTLTGTSGEEIIYVYASTGELKEKITSEKGATTFGEDYNAGLYLLRIISNRAQFSIKGLKGFN